MPADNQVILEGIAKMGSLLRDIHQAVASSEAELNKLGKDHPIVVSVAKAQADLDRTIVKLRAVAAQADRPAVVRIRTEEAERGVASLVAQVRAVGTAFDQFGPADPFGPFRQAANTAARAVEDLSSRTTTGSKNFGQSLDRAATQAKIALEGLQREIRNTAAAGSPVPPAVVAQVDRLETEYRQATVAAHQFRVAQAGVRAELRSSAPPLAELNASLGRVASTVKAFVVAAAVNELRQLGGQAFTTSEQFKAIDRQLDAALGSSEKAAKGFAFVKAESDRLGFGLLGAVDGYARLASAARGTSLEGEGVNRVFTQFAERAAVARLSSEDFAGVIRALEQIVSKGTLSMEELRQQLGDRLPGTLRLAGKALGFSEGEFKGLFDLVKSNSVSSIEFVQRFGDIVQREIAEKVPEASAAATAEVNRLKNEWLLAQQAAGDELAPAVAELAKTLRELLVDGQPTAELFGKIAGLLVTLAEKTVNVHQLFKDLAGFGAAFDVMGFQVTSALAGITGSLAALARATGLDDLADGLTRALGKIEGTAANFARDLGERLSDAEKHFKKLTGAADEAAPALKGAGAAASGAGDDIDFAARKMDAAITEILDYVAAVEKSGSVQQAEADRIVRAIDQQLKAIRELPGAEGVAFKLREQQLEELRDKYFEFTTAYEKEQEKQAKAAERLADREAAALERRAEKIKQFFDSARRSAGERADTSAAGASDDLLKAREELAGLEGKGLLETDDIRRIDELRESIKQLEGESQKAGAAVRQVAQATAASSEDIANDLRELQEFVSGEDFRAAFLELPADISAAVEETVRGYERIVAAEGATADGAERFRQALVTLFQGGAEAADVFAGQLQGAGVTAGSVGAVFDTMRQQVSGGNQALEGTATAAQTAATGFGTVAVAAPAAADAVDKTKESFISLIPRVDEATAAESNLAGAISKSGSAADGSAKGAAALGEKTAELGRAANEAADDVVRWGDALVPIGDQARDAAGGVGEIGMAAKEAGEPLGTVASHLKEVKDADPAKTFGDAADQTARAATASKDLATGLGNVVKAVTEGEDELHTLATRGGEIAEGWRKADTALSGFNERAGIAIGLCKDLQECLAGLASA